VGALPYLFGPDQSKFAAAYTKAITAYPHFYITSAAVAKLQLAASAAWLIGQDPSGRHVRALRVPTLVGDGAKDVLLPTPNSVKLAHLIRGARLVLYPDAGHGFLFQDERAWTARIERFLRGR
jgi:pimeloyl-ACP methyl ester carboxylesterase